MRRPWRLWPSVKPLDMPTSVGVPDSVPDDDRVSPCSSALEVTAKLYCAVPPEAVKVWV